MLGFWEWAVLLGIASAVALIVSAVRAYGRQRHSLIESAIEANQPEVATALIQDRWSIATRQGLVIAGLGMGMFVAVFVEPVSLSGLLLPAAALICAGVPMTVYSHLCARLEGNPGGSGLAIAAAAALLAAGITFAAATRAHFARLPSPAESREFRARVRSLIDAAPGTRSPVIDGHQAQPCLTGNGYAQQSCGSPYHDGIRFSTTEPGFLNVYYIPDTEQYLVIGKALVTPAGKVVTDGYISAKEALAVGSEASRR
jgi:hypothetical protein